MSNKKCYEIIKCPFYNTEPKKSNCPVYKEQIGCYRYNWGDFYKQMPEGKEKQDWKIIMLQNCPKCEVHKLHNKEVDSFLIDLMEG